VKSEGIIEKENLGIPIQDKVRSNETLSFRGTPADPLIDGGWRWEKGERANFEPSRSDTASSFRNLENIELFETNRKSVSRLLLQ